MALLTRLVQKAIYLFILIAFSIFYDICQSHTHFRVSIRTHTWMSAYSCIAPGARAAPSPAFVCVVVEGHTYAGHTSEYPQRRRSANHPNALGSSTYSARTCSLWANPLYSVCEDGCGSCACHTGSVGPDQSLAGIGRLHRATCQYPIHAAIETPTPSSPQALVQNYAVRSVRSGSTQLPSLLRIPFVCTTSIMNTRDRSIRFSFYTAVAVIATHPGHHTCSFLSAFRV
ncbi:hypothetical protein BJ912DRAFT_1041242 [Pholiota molesta]|nr:hypothetical protein BJ912DRAFT_1041242 [Pholiota molesta]